MRVLSFLIFFTQIKTLFIKAGANLFSNSIFFIYSRNIRILLIRVIVKENVIR